MTPPFAILLIIGAVGIFALALKKIRRSEIAVADSVFWFFFALSLVILAVFPRLAFVIADVLGFQSVVNFVFLYVIAVLLVKMFYMTAEIARLRAKQAELIQEKALTDLDAGRFGYADADGAAPGAACSAQDARAEAAGSRAEAAAGAGAEVAAAAAGAGAAAAGSRAAGAGGAGERR
ncbi:DUF2304 domain-containing protein [Adlercreutzia sp. ZJ473]|uniref:DUF2304 domain-containing protein n=1 Tax=Adlercreutzia sp. ZJ473 TaxID=2722822 RepID=UPI00155627D0